jgi:hypothetical protein
MLSHLSERETSDAHIALPLPDKNRNDPLTIHVLYTTRIPGPPSTGSQKKHETVTADTLRQILFLPRLRNIVQRASSSQPSNLHISLDLFLTNLSPAPAVVTPAAALLTDGGSENIRLHPRRITVQDLEAATTANNAQAPPRSTVCYVCGPPPMTDEFVQSLGTLVGSDRVLCEKWW